MEAKVQSKAATTTSVAPVMIAGSGSSEPMAQIAPPSAEPPKQSSHASSSGTGDPGEAATSATPRESASPANSDNTSTARQSAAEAARQARGRAKHSNEAHHVEMSEPTTRISRGTVSAADKGQQAAPARTQLVRGKAKVSRAAFHQDPVVGWLVVVGGPGLGAFRPIFEGNNTLGRASSQRIPVDFGDDTISSEEQAYIRYDSIDRTFLFVPNLAKTNVVQVNNQKPTGAVPLSSMDVITMGRTQLVFVPFCGADFDWSELSNLKE